MSEAARTARHELRTPVNHILSYARLVHEEAAELGLADLLPHLEVIAAAGQQALALIDDLLAPSPDDSDVSRDRARTSLRSLAERLEEQTNRLRRESAAAGRESVADDLGRIWEAALQLLAHVENVATASSETRREEPPLPLGEGEERGVAHVRFAGEGYHGTLLVVDDNEANRDVLSRSLVRLGYSVRCAENGRVALDLLAATDVDLVLLDIMMPELDGYGVLERRRADPRLRDVPFIVISATGDDESVIRCIELGAEDYLPKPFDPVLLRARIGACLEKKRLHDAERRLHEQEQRQLATIQAQAAELAEWNQALERRVAEQVARLERIERLKRFLPSQLAETIVATGDESLLESHRRQIAVVFCDLRGFTPFAETAEPEEVMDVLAEYHATMGELISRFEGTVEHFAADGLMVLFNDPLPCPDAEARAVRMALQMRARMAELSADWRKRGHALGFGVGISLGYATLGRIGFEGRLHYAAIGSVVNLAARLCGEAKDGQILVSQRVCAAVEGLVRTEAVGDLSLKGFHNPVPAFEVVGP
ncbi:MAG: response regulator [Solirubrobacterales bacterium]|nr:response regulator [Solirubrobacterales bacterium]